MVPAAATQAQNDRKLTLKTSKIRVKCDTNVVWIGGGLVQLRSFEPAFGRVHSDDRAFYSPLQCCVPPLRNARQGDTENYKALALFWPVSASASGLVQGPRG